MIGIYKITSPTNRIYIGQSRNIKYRFNNYKALRCNQQPRLYKSLLKHGVKNHKFEVIEECNIELLNERERYWQDFYNVLSKNGLNCSLINTNEKPYVFSKEAILKMKSWERPKGENHHFFGKKRPEHSEKIKGENHFNWGKKNIKLSEWNKINKKGNKNMLGKKLSEETKKNISKKVSGVNHRMYGKKHSQETIEKMKLNNKRANLGKKASEETRLKISLIHKGRKQSEEHKEKRRLKAIGNKSTSKIVLDLNTGVYYESAKEIHSKGMLNISYSYFLSKLSGRNINDTNYIYA